MFRFEFVEPLGCSLTGQPESADQDLSHTIWRVYHREAFMGMLRWLMVKLANLLTPPRLRSKHEAWISHEGQAMYLNVRVAGHHRRERMPRHLLKDRPLMVEEVKKAAARMKQKIVRGEE